MAGVRVRGDTTRDADRRTFGVLSRVPGPGAIRPIVAGWLAAVATVRFGVLGGAGAGWTVWTVALLALQVAVQASYIVAGRRLRGTALGWCVVAAQAVLTYLPFVLFGHNWMAGNSGFLLGAVLLTAGPIAGLPLAVGVAAGEVLLSYSVLHMTQASYIAYAVTAPVDNGVQFWSLVTLAQVAADLRTERTELARLAEAEERSRAERTLRDVFDRLLVGLEDHVTRGLRSLAVSSSQAADDVAAAVRTARECQSVVRSAADSELHPETDSPTAHDAGSVRSALSGQLVAVVALNLLLVAYLLQGLLDGVDGQITALLVPASGAMILGAIVALYRRRDELGRPGSRVAAYLRVVAVGGAVAFPVVSVVIAVLTAPPAGVWAGAGFLVAGIVLVQWRVGMTWGALLALPAGTVALMAVITPDSYTSSADMIYYFASIAAIGADSYGMVRLVQFEGALARTRRRAVTLAALRERTRVARDVHDLLGLGITTLVLKGELAARLLDSDPERARTHLTEMRRLAAEAAAGARAVVAAGGGGSEASVRAELVSAERTLSGAGIAVDLQVAEETASDPVDAVCGVVLREAITNVLRHSAAEKVRIAFGFEAGRVRLRVENDGLHEAAADLGPGGRGLRNMASRVAEAGGEFDAAAADGWFRLSVDLPM
ncbi:signal transduction histidine kinase [Catenulispora sp. GP43]|uniref:sensor histidine kinase n=1 Tax=Catenulispora sp. GP43 TaxID=3156263 RepID=UPI0035133B51